MKRRNMNAWSLSAIALAVTGIALGLAALIQGNPFLGLFAITVVCSGGVSALIGLQDGT